MRRLLTVTLLLAGLVSAIASCAKKKEVFAPNLPPETLVFVRGSLDTVAHVVHLYWFGSDPDGNVVDFQVRFVNPAAPADTQWVSTAHDDSAHASITDSLFVVYTPEGFSAPRFEVRAVDNQGAVDPSPAVQVFKFKNDAPLITLTGSPPIPDSTFASATLAWRAVDPDGDAGRMTFRAWLDGAADTVSLPAGTTSLTFPTDAFRDQAGNLVAGRRTAFVQASDDGGRRSQPVSYSWNVKLPVTGAEARLLVVDDLPSTVSGANIYDTFYRTVLGDSVPAGTYTILDLERWNPFRSAQDLYQTLKLFHAVVWYREINPSTSALLHDYQAGLERYLAGGGNFYISSYDLIEGPLAQGVFTLDFAQQFLNCDSLYLAPIQGRPERTASWDIRSGRQIRSTIYQDSLKASINSTGLRAFAVQDTGLVAFWARDSVLTQINPVDVAVALQVPRAGGKGIFLSFALRGMNSFANPPRVLGRVLRELGVLSPIGGTGARLAASDIAARGHGTSVHPPAHRDRLAGARAIPRRGHQAGVHP